MIIYYFFVTIWNFIFLVVISEDEAATTIEGKYVKSPREGYLLKFDKTNCSCSLCALDIEVLHTVSFIKFLEFLTVLLIHEWIGTSIL